MCVCACMLCVLCAFMAKDNILTTYWCLYSLHLHYRTTQIMSTINDVQVKAVDVWDF